MSLERRLQRCSSIAKLWNFRNKVDAGPGRRCINSVRMKCIGNPSIASRWIDENNNTLVVYIITYITILDTIFYQLYANNTYFLEVATKLYSTVRSWHGHALKSWHHRGLYSLSIKIRDCASIFQTRQHHLKIFVSWFHVRLHINDENNGRNNDVPTDGRVISV